MIDSTLIVSRAVNLHSHYQKQFVEMGFNNVSVTGKEKDGLSMLIRKTKPAQIIIDAGFYKCCTPYMVGELKKEFSNINFAAVAVSEYPADLAMYFYINAGCSYAYQWDGMEEYNHGLDVIRKGKEYVSPTVRERINIRQEKPTPSITITERQKEVIRCVCNGFSDIEVADTLAISKRTVNNDKKDVFASLSVRNEKELIRSALHLGYISEEELHFYGRDYVLRPNKFMKNKGRQL
jgi:DNA-binding NarL/FixJ family response regulator